MYIIQQYFLKDIQKLLAKTRAELGERDSEISRLRLSLDQMEQISSYNQLKEENAILR